MTNSAGCRVTWKNLGGLSGSEPGPRRAAALDTGGLCAVPRQADVLETGDFGGDKLGGLELAGFSGQKTDFGARRTPEPGFPRKTSEFGGPAAQKTQGTKNTLFGVRRFQRFLLQKRSGDEAVTSLVTSVFWTKFGCFGAFFGQNPQN